LAVGPVPVVRAFRTSTYTAAARNRPESGFADARGRNRTYGLALPGTAGRTVSGSDLRPQERGPASTNRGGRPPGRRWSDLDRLVGEAWR
jgi:hypothetical protein